MIANIRWSGKEKGQWVLLSDPATKKGLSPKLSFKFSGPFEVIRVTPDTPNVMLKKVGSPQSQVKRVHVNRLKPYYRQGFRGGEIVSEGTVGRKPEDGVELSKKTSRAAVQNRGRALQFGEESGDASLEEQDEDPEFFLMWSAPLLPDADAPEVPADGEERHRRQIRLPDRFEDYDIT